MQLLSVQSVQRGEQTHLNVSPPFVICSQKKTNTQTHKFEYSQEKNRVARSCLNVSPTLVNCSAFVLFWNLHIWREALVTQGMPFWGCFVSFITHSWEDRERTAMSCDNSSVILIFHRSFSVFVHFGFPTPYYIAPDIVPDIARYKHFLLFNSDCHNGHPW